MEDRLQRGRSEAARLVRAQVVLPQVDAWLILSRILQSENIVLGVFLDRLSDLIVLSPRAPLLVGWIDLYLTSLYLNIFSSLS